MLRSRRILVVGSLLVIGWVLHTTLCEWGWKRNISARSRTPILVYRHPPEPNATGRREHPATGLFAQSRWREVTIFFGVVIPMALCATAGYLVLGWRNEDAIRLGRCPRCGYDRRGDRFTAGARCPECGWRRGD